MEDEKCSNVLAGRKRTESNGGNSDSDLSDGWNIVDHLDTNSQELPSSDGESVEVIDGDDDILQNGDADLDTEEDGLATEAIPSVSQSDCSTAMMSVDDPPSLVLPPHREEMFDSSFYWFLLTASFAVLVSHLAFMAAENVLSWNTDMSYESPSFMRDLPTTTKSLPHNNLADKISWASNEEVNVELVDDMSYEEPGNTVVNKLPLSADVTILRKENQNVDKLPIKIDNHELGKQFKILSEMTTSVEAQRKFAQAMLIVDSLHIGINDLEEIVTDNSELNHLLEKQKSKINKVLTEVKFGVSRSLERVATNVFNKIQTLERRFEKQWCKLEQNGYKEKLNGLFYDCEEFINKAEHVRNKKLLGKTKANTVSSKEQHDKKQILMDSYKYEVDKDSTGKVHSKEKSGNGDNNEYYKLVKKENLNKNKIKHKLHDFTNYNDINSLKFKKNNKKERRKSDHLNHLPENKTSDKRYTKKEKYTSKSDRNSKGDPVIEKSIEEVVSKILKELCLKNKNVRKQPTKSGDYQQLKEKVNNKLKVSKELFEKLYVKFCVHNSDAINKEYSKQDNKDNILKRNNMRDKNLIIETSSTANILNFKISSSPEISRQDVKTISDSIKDKVIEPVNQNEWTLSYEIPPPINKTNTNGEWFLKSGESRSHVRWSHQRSDWWFDRSSQRRHYQYNYPHPSNWFVGRRKNWFFRRAWARQQCKESPHNNWCHLDDDTVTIPNSNFS